MTMAVCLKCGEIKFGAFCPCSCGYCPSEPEELAKHLMVTDHYFPLETLKQIGAVIQEGREVKFRPEDVASTVKMITETAKLEPNFFKNLAAMNQHPADAEDAP